MKMKHLAMALLFFQLFLSNIAAQNFPEQNTDVLLTKGLQAYKEQNFRASLHYSNRGLSLAPEYHDIRILRIRNLWALEQFPYADVDLFYLLEEAPQYPGVKKLALQRIRRFEDPRNAVEFIDLVLKAYPDAYQFQIQKAQLLFNLEQFDAARDLATKLFANKAISGSDRYLLGTILDATVKQAVGLNFQQMWFRHEDSGRELWSIASAEYQYNSKRTPLIARTTFTDRGHGQGFFYELEAYPVLTERTYAFTSIGFSDGELFPVFRGSASLYSSFFGNFVAEAGSRLLISNDQTYFTGIIGLTGYWGKFYWNGRLFLGPEKKDHLIQNYQVNVRYYFFRRHDYFAFRLGTGISPDETTLLPLDHSRSALGTWYGQLGINKTLGIHHLVKFGGGVLLEEITQQRKGTRIIASVGYRFRF